MNNIDYVWIERQNIQFCLSINTAKCTTCKLKSCQWGIVEIFTAEKGYQLKFNESVVNTICASTIEEHNNRFEPDRIVTNETIKRLNK
jgi:hypothetical protein